MDLAVESGRGNGLGHRWAPFGAVDTTGRLRLCGAVFLGMTVLSYTQLNYACALVVHISGQAISTLTILLACGAIMLCAPDLVGRRFSRPGLYWVVAFIALSYVVPALSYAVSLRGGDVSGLVFWAKRAGINLFVVLSGLALIRLRGRRGLFDLARAVFLISSVSTIFSYFFPLPSLFVFSGAFTEPNLELVSLDRAGGSFLNPNTAATAICFAYAALVVCLDVGAWNPSFWRKAITDALLLLSIALTGSRAGAGGALLLLLASILIARRQRPTAAFLYATALAGVAAMLLTFAALKTDNSPSPLARLVTPGSSDASESNRLRLIGAEQSIALTMSHPVLGIGFERLRNELVVAPHNMYLAYALENGVVLGALYPAFLLGALLSIRPSRIGWTAAVCTLAAMSWFDHTILDSKQIPLLILAWFAARDDAEA